MVVSPDSILVSLVSAFSMKKTPKSDQSNKNESIREMSGIFRKLLHNRQPDNS